MMVKFLLVQSFRVIVGWHCWYVRVGADSDCSKFVWCLVQYIAITDGPDDIGEYCCWVRG